MKITPVLLLAASLFCFVAVVARNDDTGLFHEEADYDAGHVLKYHHNGTFKSPNRQKRRLPPVRLAYVTPWNKLGYTRVLEHPAAFTHVSPCWFEAQRDAAAAVLSPGKLAATVVNGAGHINATWGFRLSETGVKVLPRVLVNLGDLGADVFTSAAASQAFSKSVTKAVLGPDAKFSKWVSGIVLDWGGFPLSNAQLAPPEGVKRFLTDLRQTLSETSDKDEFLIVLVIPPDANAIQPKQYKWLHPLVDYFQVMTYDFNGGATAPKENAPMTWVETVIRSILRVKKESPTELTKNDAFPRSKLLMGVNLYGARFTRGGKPRETLDGKGWIKLLTEERKMTKALNPNITKKELDGRPALVWGSETCEHSAELYVPKSGVEFVFYPSIAGLLHRVHYATVIGLGGVAAWELGQGLEYFTPVFEP